MPNGTSSALKLQIVKLTDVGFCFFLKALDGVNYAVKMYNFFSDYSTVKWIK